MATRVDPAMYSDTPIFQALLDERKGRWPGIPMEELPAIPVSYDGAPYTLPVMSRVQPIQDVPSARLRPYTPLQPLPAIDPEATAEMPLPRAVGD